LKKKRKASVERRPEYVRNVPLYLETSFETPHGTGSMLVLTAKNLAVCWVKLKETSRFLTHLPEKEQRAPRSKAYFMPHLCPYGVVLP